MESDVRFENNSKIRLNQFIAHAGICSRRKADALISAGDISVNGNPVTVLGTKIGIADVVSYKGEILENKKKVYFLVNKPENYICTLNDPYKRLIITQLLPYIYQSLVYPIGRLDRNTTGLIVLTNDGDLTQKLIHPKYQIQKVYYVRLDKPLIIADYNKIAFGTDLEDGFFKPDNIQFVNQSERNEVMIRLHSGRNRIIRRLFQHYHYKVIHLDRKVFGTLNQEHLPIGKYRPLKVEEIKQLKSLVSG